MAEFTASPQKLLQGLSKSSSTDCLLFTAGAPGGAIINSILLHNTTNTDQLVQIYIKDDEDVNATVQSYEKVFEETILAKSTFIFKGPIVLNTDDQLGVKSLSNDIFNVFVFGAELV